MLTIFATPKPFRGHFDLIQRNAIHSWTLLRPACDIILLGDETGTKDVACEFGLRHVAKVKRNEYGTPLVCDLFEQSEQLSAHDTLCYVNCDIILMGDFTRAMERVMDRKGRFLVVGRRWNLDINQRLDFTKEWENKLRDRLRQNGTLEVPSAIDYFVFSRGLWGEIPPFAVGRAGWDNWMVYRARSLRAAVIDATAAISAVHQNHDYSHLPQGEYSVFKGDEARRNLQLLDRRGFTIEDATHILTLEKLQLTYDQRHLWRHFDTLPNFYPWLGLPIRLFLWALQVSHPLRSFLGLTLASSTAKPSDE